MEVISIHTPRRGKKRLGQQVSKDPLNKHWANDKEKFGFKMLMKMGWSEGKGLGLNENGSIEYVKAKTIKNKEGLGVSVETRNDWDVNNRDLDDIFAGLNANNVPIQKESASESEEETESKSNVVIPRHLIVQKRHKAKNVRNYSKNDLAAILGVKPTPKTSTKSQSEDDVFKSDVPTVNASESIFDYFKKKAAELDSNNENKDNNQNDNEIISNSESESELNKKKKEKKEKRN